MTIRQVVAAPLVGLSLASCATLGGGSTGTVTDIIGQVITQAQAICHYQPLFENVALIISHSPQVQTAAQLAQAICAAVAAPVPTNLRTFVAPTKPTLYGVTIEGRFI